MNSATRQALVFCAALLIFAGAGSALAQAVTCSGTLPPGNGEDLEVTEPCTVGAGTYHYRNVNIYGGGSLLFADAAIDFWAMSILVERNGSLIAGSPAEPIGTHGGVVTIYLYGPDQGPGTGTGNHDGGLGIVCKYPPNSSTGPCGIPKKTWDTNGASKVKLPGGVSDYFYQYDHLPYDDGVDDHNSVGYFGYKVLAVSYDGTLQLFGKKGALYESLRGVDPSDSGTSWVRLAKTLQPGDTRLVLDRAVDWEMGDRIVVTTTDYLPGHSEELQITAVVDAHTIEVNRIDPLTNEITTDTNKGVQYIHNGDAYPLKAIPKRLGLDFTHAETRAAVALLSRSIRIVSAGDAFGQPFPKPLERCGDESPDCQFFGGHTIVRQGVRTYQVQGVEFSQLGQGGRLGHYPVHFHLARKTPQNTFVKDCSIHDSMTRWITLHGTHNVTLARNVGYLSIGHGYYLEDGTEIDNKFHANIGIYARAAAEIDEKTPQRDNPRQVPGILSAPPVGFCSNDNTKTCTASDQCGTGNACLLPRSMPHQSDWVHPTVFWIMNGWNEFEGNMAAGAGACGACYWPVTGSISGPSRDMTWESYASIQKGADRGGTAPLKQFTKNYCTTAMHSFNSTPDTAECLGVVSGSSKRLNQIPNPLALKYNPDVAQESYYPIVVQTLPAYTRCDKTDCSTVEKCANDKRENCMVAVLDRYTSSFHWAQTNFSAIWLRPRWFLVINSVITDVQNAGLTFVTGGDYTHSSVIPGNWMLARKNVFIGHTQKCIDPVTKKVINAYVCDAGPFNPAGLACDNPHTEANNYCISLDEGISMPLTGFGVNQRLFNIYDGPSLQDSNAYLDINRTDITDENCPFPNDKGQCNDSEWMYGRVLGVPGAEIGGKLQCYLPNAAIAWKQPNGFYYPPAFHSTNLFFDNVDIRHYVIEPLFLPEVRFCSNDKTKTCTSDAQCGADGPCLPLEWFKTDQEEAKKRYCTWNPGSFAGWTAIDRQTILNDDDGSLTGLKNTASVNEDPFFNAPIEAVECASEGTAKTSPYDYVTTVVYPDCGVSCDQAIWNANCTAGCYGVPLYRQYLTGPEKAETNPNTKIRMMGPLIGGRINLTVNHGKYYIATTDGAEAQKNAALKNIFQAGQTYYVFLVYAKPTTTQTYQMYVGQGLPKDFRQTNVKAVRVDLATKDLQFKNIEWPSRWDRDYRSDTGILTVTMNLQPFSDDFDAARADICQPKSFCEWQDQDKQCQCSLRLLRDNPRLYNECRKDNHKICSDWAVKDLDCPAGGCLGFAVTLPTTFVADGTDHRPKPACFPLNFDWIELWRPVSRQLAGSCFNPPLEPPAFCQR